MNSTFTALGVSGTGKTCYIVGLYNDIQEKNRTFSMTVVGHNKKMLENWVSRMNSVRGAEKFPSGTSQANMTDYQFVIHAGADEIISIDWLDYPGGALHERENSIDAFEQLNTSIRKSAALYIFLDGDNFCYETPEKILRKARREAQRINDYIAKVAEANEGNLPPIVFVITKSDKYVKYISSTNEVENIIRKLFNSLFVEGREAYIVPVSLGNNIADDNYSGDADPISVHIPFLIGVYHNYSDICRGYARDIDDTNRRTQMEIEAQRVNQIKEENRIFFKRRGRIDEYKRNIEAARADIAENKEIKENYFRLLRAVSDELLRESRTGFIYFCDGEKRDFIPRD